jgi:hypothetical protein
MGEPMDRFKSPFVSPTTFEGLFPNLEDVIFRGTVGESAHNRDPIGFSLRERGGLIRCPNSKCWSGGFVVDDPADDMQREGATEKDVRIRCEGRVNSYKGHRLGQPCPYSIEGKIELKFKVPEKVGEKK